MASARWRWMVDEFRCSSHNGICEWVENTRVFGWSGAWLRIRHRCYNLSNNWNSIASKRWMRRTYGLHRMPIRQPKGHESFYSCWCTAHSLIDSHVEWPCAVARRIFLILPSGDSTVCTRASCTLTPLNDTSIRKSSFFILHSFSVSALTVWHLVSFSVAAFLLSISFSAAIVCSGEHEPKMDFPQRPLHVHGNGFDDTD